VCVGGAAEWEESVVVAVRGRGEARGERMRSRDESRELDDERDERGEGGEGRSALCSATLFDDRKQQVRGKGRARKSKQCKGEQTCSRPGFRNPDLDSVHNNFLQGIALVLSSPSSGQPSERPDHTKALPLSLPQLTGDDLSTEKNGRNRPCGMDCESEQRIYSALERSHCVRVQHLFDARHAPAVCAVGAASEREREKGKGEEKRRMETERGYHERRWRVTKVRRNGGGEEGGDAG
jgi:hypothetical protein